MQKVKSVPRGKHTVTPHLVCAGAADAIAFYRKAFGAVEELVLPGAGGKVMHASMKIGDSSVMIREEAPEMGALGPKTLHGSPVAIHLYVDDVDKFVSQAVQAGAKVTMAPEDQFWGDRMAGLDDPFGHHWTVGTHVRDVSEKQMLETAKKMSEEKAPAGESAARTKMREEGGIGP